MDRTKKKLVEAAREVLKNMGEDKTTTLEIAKAAGLSEMTLFRKFKNKENLIHAAHYVDTEKALPSSYDYFYSDFMILKKALSLRDDVLGNINSELVAGYAYFIEFCTGKLIQNVEEAPYNEHIFEIVNWGRFDISNQEIQHLKKNSHSFKMVFELNELRGLLSGLRRKVLTQEVKKELGEVLEKLEKLNNGINSEVEIMYKAKKRTAVDETTEKLMIFHWFMVTYVYEPPRLFFSTMTNETAQSFRPEQRYLLGFKFCAESVMNWLTENKYAKLIKEGLAELNTLEYLHDFYSKMHGTVFKDVNTVRIFDIINPNWEGKALLRNKKIVYPYQLNLISRGRQIKVINVVEDGVGIRSDRDAVQRLFMDAIFGGIAQGVPKLEIVQFEEFIKDGKKDWDRYYSYALYLPMHGMIGDASSWLVFPRLDGASSWEPWDDVRRRVERIAMEWKGRVVLRKYKIDPKVLKKYLDNKDWATVLKKDMESRFNDGKGLLGEFLGYFYLWKSYGAKLIEFDKKVPGTDVDVIAEDENNRYILQAKNTITSNRKRLYPELDEIIKQFGKIEKTYSIEGKTTKKILFVIDWDWNMDKALEVEDWDTYLVNTSILANNYLKKSGIEFVVYKNMRITEKGYEGFTSKIKSALNIFDENDLK